MNNMEQTMVKNVYEDIAEHFNKTRTYKWFWVGEFLDSLKAHNMVYDIGCGNGRNMTHENLHFIGVDNCENFLKICSQKNFAVINSNITQIALKDNTADAIICIAVLHHLYTEENRITALLEMKRLIKSGGKILISVWSINQPPKTRRTFKKYGNNIVLWNQFGKIYERYYYIFKLDELKKLIKSVGLIIIDYKYDCGNEIFTLMKI
jgi:ubiquinone/menaquinone biosynthesis C-methylase UbiE